MTEVGINPDADDARETPVLTPTTSPLVSIMGEPGRIDEGSISVTSVSGTFVLGSDGSIWVTSPCAIAVNFCPEIATTTSPSCGSLCKSVAGTHLGMGDVDVAGVRNTIP